MFSNTASIILLHVLAFVVAAEQTEQPCKHFDYDLDHLHMRFYDTDKYITCFHGKIQCFQRQVDIAQNSHHAEALEVECPSTGLASMIEEHEPELTTTVEVAADGSSKTPTTTSHRRLKEGTSNRRRRLAVVSDSDRLWEGGVVCFQVLNQFTQTQLSIYYKAMQQIELMTHVRFLREDQCQTLLARGISYCDGCRTFNKVAHAGGSSTNCNATVGSSTGQSSMYLGNRCFQSDGDLRDDHGTIMHELGHSVGLYHEHQNPNADLIFDYNQISTANWDNFRPRPDLFSTPGDLFSVMMYPSTSGFCVVRRCLGGETVGTCLQPGRQACTLNLTTNCERLSMPAACDTVLTASMGQRRYLSRQDCLTLRTIYPQAAWSLANSYIGSGSQVA